MKQLAIALCLSLLACAVWAKPIRVNFPQGRTAVVLKGTTTGGPSEHGGMDPISYILRASAGQTMTLHLTSGRKNAVFGVIAPGMEPLQGPQNVDDWSGRLPKTGDYEIMVFPQDQKTNTPFTLEIMIR